MKSLKNKILILLACCLALQFGCGAAKGGDYVKVKGSGYVEGKKEFVINSISYKLNKQDKSVTKLTSAYKDMKKMGFNSTRLLLDYTFFESDKKTYSYLKSGWELLDAQIAAAKKAGIKLIFNMHFPQGGYQSQGAGNALWQNADNQSRLVSLWGEIAKRYAKEKAIIGYGILNEPVPFAQTDNEAIAKWETLANDCVNRIRKFDKNHIIFIEQAARRSGGDKNMVAVNLNAGNNYGLVLVDDKNAAYEFHFYDDYVFTHQQEPKNNAQMPFRKYPSSFMGQDDKEEWIVNSKDNQAFDVGKINQPWQELKSGMMKIDSSNIDYVMAGLSLYGMGQWGEIWADEIYVKEYDQNGSYIKDVLYLNFENTLDFYLSNSNSGKAFYNGTGGYAGKGGTLYASGVIGDGTAVFNEAKIPVTQGNSYQMSILIGGANVEWSSAVAPLLMAYDSEHDLLFDKQYLRKRLDTYFAYGKKKNIPLFLGEFGAIKYCFENDKGGVQYVKDIMDIIKSHGASSSYFSYGDDYFGIYKESGAMLVKDLQEYFYK